MRRHGGIATCAVQRGADRAQGSAHEPSNEYAHADTSQDPDSQPLPGPDNGHRGRSGCDLGAVAGMATGIVLGRITVARGATVTKYETGRTPTAREDCHYGGPSVTAGTLIELDNKPW